MSRMTRSHSRSSQPDIYCLGKPAGLNNMLPPSTGYEHISARTTSGRNGVHPCFMLAASQSERTPVSRRPITCAVVTARWRSCGTRDSLAVGHESSFRSDPPCAPKLGMRTDHGCLLVLFSCFHQSQLVHSLPRWPHLKKFWSQT